jgi:hypothetical protein
VDYRGGGKRTLFGSEEGDKDKFAARAFVIFEEYSGLVHRVPAPGRMSIHDVSTVGGTRTGAGVDIWITNRRFEILNAGAEFRNEINAKTASQRNSDETTYSLITDPVEIANYQRFSTMESEFNAEVRVLGMTLVSMPISATNNQPFDPKLQNLRLLSYTSEVAMGAKFFVLEVRTGATFTFYVDLRLTNQFKNIDNGVEGAGTIALIPGIDVTGFSEAGVNIVVASAHLGAKLKFINLELIPEYIMRGQMLWRNDAAAGMPVVTSNLTSQPRLRLVISTLDGEIYVKWKVLFISNTEVFFRWNGYRWERELWQGKPSDRQPLTLPLRRYDL